ncbi:MAG: hypothetical protein CL607_07545 [Anaerolineaceae bacterium]|nr:hypothetical protein [Anaerolineaceae bacterium]
MRDGVATLDHNKNAAHQSALFLVDVPDQLGRMPFVELDQIRAGALEVTNQGIFMTDQAQLVVLFATRTYV